MSKNKLLDEMIRIKDEMQNINLRLQTQNSAKSFIHEFKPQPQQKIKNLIYKLVSYENQYFNYYFISEQYTNELLNENNFEQLLILSLKMMCKILKTQQKQPINKNQTKPQTPKSTVSQIIKDIVTPFKQNITQQSQFYKKQLHSSNKQSQTEEPPDIKLPIRHSSVLSLFDNPLSSPKFNKIQDEESEEQQKVDSIITPRLDRFSQEGIAKSISSIKDRGTFSSSSSFLDSQKKLHRRNHQVFNFQRFPNKDISNQLLSVDLTTKKKKTPEKKRDFDIITNQ